MAWSARFEDSTQTLSLVHRSIEKTGGDAHILVLVVGCHTVERAALYLLVVHPCPKGTVRVIAFVETPMSATDTLAFNVGRRLLQKVEANIRHHLITTDEQAR
jgi:hypothetical protein